MQKAECRMRNEEKGRLRLGSASGTLTSALLLVASAAAATTITFDPSGTMSIDGKPTFVISFTMAPPPDGKTPNGKHAYDELREAGGNYMRVPPPTKTVYGTAGDVNAQPPVKWDDEGI